MNPPCFLAFLSLFGCTQPGRDSTDPDAVGAARTVVIITVDTVRPRILHGAGRDWEVSPTVEAFQRDAVWLRRTWTPRGLTTVALASLLTGTYPRTHHVRSDEDLALLTGPTIADRFHDLGYLTLGFTANGGGLLAFGFDEATTAHERDPDTVPDDQDEIAQVANDQLLLETFTARFATLAATDKVFAWVHLNLPHSPYYELSPWYQQFHPGTYEGPLDTTDKSSLNLVTAGALPFDDDDREHLEAVYASELREADDTVAGLLMALQDAGRYDDGVVVLGADHAEEMGDHNDYFFHDCSPYDSVIGVEYAIRAPGRWPLGRTVDAPVSVVDIAPTILDLSAAGPWDGDQAGASLVGDILDDRPPARDVFFERGVQTAGIVRGDWKYILSPEGGFDLCAPYSGADDLVYANQVEELYHLALDPDEAENLAGTEDGARSSLSEATCAWVQSADWAPADSGDGGPLLTWCAEHWPAAAD